MSLQNSSNPAGGEQVRKAQEGDPQALAALREQHHSQLFNILRARGASQTEAGDILADLWSDCVPGAGNQPSLLTKFGGRFSLLSWLARVASNRWIDQKRRGARQAGLDDSDIQALPGSPTPLEDDQLSKMLRECLQSAFDRCPGEALLLLRLVYLHDLTQREAGHLFGWSESKTSRFLSLAMRQIRKRTLQGLKQRDERFELTWEDLLGLCEDDKSTLL